MVYFVDKAVHSFTLATYCSVQEQELAKLQQEKDKIQARVDFLNKRQLSAANGQAARPGTRAFPF